MYSYEKVFSSITMILDTTYYPSLTFERELFYFIVRAVYLDVKESSGVWED